MEETSLYKLQEIKEPVGEIAIATAEDPLVVTMLVGIVVMAIAVNSATRIAADHDREEEAEAEAEAEVGVVDSHEKHGLFMSLRYIIPRFGSSKHIGQIKLALVMVAGSFVGDPYEIIIRRHRGFFVGGTFYHRNLEAKSYTLLKKQGDQATC